MFRQSLIGVFTMMLERPIVWNSATNKDAVLNYVFMHQHITRVNQTMLDQYQLSEAEMLKLTPADFFRHDLEQGRRAWRGMFDQGSLRSLTYEKRADGSGIWIEGEYSCLYDGQGRICGHIGLQQDVTARVEAERWHDYMGTIVHQLSDAIIVTDASFRITLVNSACEKLYGYTAAELIGQKPDLLNAQPDVQTSQQEIYDRVAAGSVYERVLLNRRKDGSVFVCETKVSHVQDEDGHPVAYVSITRPALDASSPPLTLADAPAHQQELVYLSSHDDLTGLFNRAYMAAALRRLERETDDQTAVIVLDVDGLKLVNDAFGHACGDVLLTTVARLFRAHCPERALVGRTGGDEFWILVPQTSTDEVRQLCQNLRAAAADETINGVPISLAIGYAVRDNPKTSLDSVLTAADSGMYRDKLKSGKRLRERIVASILAQIEAYSPFEHPHRVLVAAFCRQLAEALALSSREVHELETAGLLHDIGKIGVPRDLLNHPGPLEPAQIETVRRHAEAGYQILRSIDAYMVLAEPVLYHHERRDGTGYPEGLSGDAIPLYARILAVADAYEAMLSDRPYRKALLPSQARLRLEMEAGRSFDPELVRVFLQQVLAPAEGDDADSQQAATAIPDWLCREIVAHAPIGIAVTAEPGGGLLANDAFAAILGRPLSNVRQDGQWELVTGDPLMRIQRPDGQTAWIQIQTVPLAGNGPSAGRRLILTRDVSEHVAVKQALQESERSKSVLLSHLPGMAYRCAFDKNWTMSFVSDGCRELTGYAPEQLVDNRDLSFNALINPEHQERIWQEWIRVLEQRQSFRMEYEIQTAGGQRKWVLEMGQGVYDEQGRVQALEGIIVDISQTRKQLLQIQYLNDYDDLTGLNNRRFFTSLLAKPEAKLPEKLALLVADINGVRLVNDAFGQAEGDRLLVEVAQILKQHKQAEDLLARTGGDSFSLLMPDADETEAGARALAIQTACQQYNASSRSQGIDISLAIGIGTRASREVPLDAVRQAAEENMLKNKLLSQKSTHGALLSSIMATLYARNQETEAHAVRLARQSGMLGAALGLPQKEMDDLEVFAMLHDIGKVAIDDRILNKPGQLNAAEWAIMKRHPEVGSRIAASAQELAPIARYILHHHERWDGQGYPAGLKGEEIPLLSRILAIADAYDAMTEERVYRKALSRADALQEIESCAGTQFDPQLAKLFVRLMRTHQT
ncbi:MAG: diguanylate cyclase [Clostridiaceae bacterium]|nr:diguanylate cyclase [Clostridiaceae bacterium]